MARRDDDDDDSEAYQEKPRRKPPRPESSQPAKPRRPPPPDDDDDEQEARSRRRPRDDDDEDDRPRRRPRDDDDDDYDDRPRRRKGGAIIPYRNGMALASYYCGFGGLICILGAIALAVVTAPTPNLAIVYTMMYGGGSICALLAIGFGIAGCLKANRDPEARGTAHAIIGIALGGLEIIGLILIMIIGLAVLR